MIAPMANYYGELYNLPFNMNTFYKLWGTGTPQEAREVIAKQRVAREHPCNLEEHVLNMVGRDIYEKLVKGYTEKQYGKPCSELPASLIGRMPLLFTYENDYLRKRYQGVPVEGYDALFERMLAKAEVHLGTDFLHNRLEFEHAAKHIVYTGAIDEYYDYRFGPLEYRGRRFESEVLKLENYQGCALMNYTDSETPWLRSIEHKHFNHDESKVTLVTKEYATDWHPGEDPYYPLENDENAEAYRHYFELSCSHEHIWFGGRLGEYRYYDMAETVRSALSLARKLKETA